MGPAFYAELKESRIASKQLIKFKCGFLQMSRVSASGVRWIGIFRRRGKLFLNYVAERLNDRAPEYSERPSVQTAECSNGRTIEYQKWRSV